MIRTQIQLTLEQAKRLKKMSKKENKSVAELIRMSVDKMINSDGPITDEMIKQKAFSLVGKFQGPSDFSDKHDDYLTETYSS